MSGIDRVDPTALGDIEITLGKTFVVSETDSHLVIKRLKQVSNADGDLAASGSQWTTEEPSYEALLEYCQVAEPCQIYCIGQKNSYARLYITRKLFSHLLASYSIFNRFWDFLVPFSFKTHESDLVNAPFRFRQREHLKSPELGSFECAYGFRYVELSQRNATSHGNPDYDPWSLRQTAVYQRYDREYNRIMFILISPSETARNNLEAAVKKDISRSKKLNAFHLHRIFISAQHENWRLYVRSLEENLTQQSERVILAQIEDETLDYSPLTDIKANFIDRQRLKMIEDKILDLIIIFESLLDTLSKLVNQCKIHCLGDACTDCTCATTVGELEEQIHEVQINLKKVEILHKRVQGTEQLLSDFLDYENAKIAQVNEKALTELARETKEENSKMRILTERSAADAAAVRILTIITLIYLPMTVVASFFSTQLIRVNEDGKVSVVSGAWWFAAISIPLTVLTFGIWKWWLMQTIKMEGHRHEEGIPMDMIGDRHKKLNWPTILRHRHRRATQDNLATA